MMIITKRITLKLELIDKRTIADMVRQAATNYQFIDMMRSEGLSSDFLAFCAASNWLLSKAMSFYSPRRSTYKMNVFEATGLLTFLKTCPLEQHCPFDPIRNELIQQIQSQL